ncbi:hypothetical protein FDB24_13175 [Clostridium botulinum]|uniref:hypothetical protein n=1 Tax=Clostridium botulinum TaxID=1491 RepID=UPI00077359E4|nr:hypothetical protein [Clostridium botulinum]NFL86871.1 hypothetical protein [Clostridium botulinum]NFO22190.1 hypothetical protein [Clostridium botulinum]
MKENWYALFASIIFEESIDKALGRMDIRPKRTFIKNNINLSESDVLVLEYLKEYHTWKELGDMCGVKGELLRMKVRNYKKNTKELCRATLIGINLKNNSISL